jgi:hypothetical protein
MRRKPKDRHLDTPSEANRDRHINFIAIENDEVDPSDQPPTGKLAAAPKKNTTKSTREAGDKKVILPKRHFLGLIAITLLFCSLIYLLMLKAVALLLTVA